LEALKERGLRAPEDIGVLGVDNLAESALLPTPLSSLEFSGPELGEAAIGLLLEAIDGRHPDGRLISCPGRVIWRASVADAPKRDANTGSTI
jgi:LacI family transcriptional regulator